MKRFLATLLTLALLFAPGGRARGDVYIPTGEAPQFTSLSDPALMLYLEDSISAGLEEQFEGLDYRVEGVRAVYYSKEYLEELAYNSQSNIFFGCTLAELDEQFEGTAYVFTLGEDSKTTVTEFQDYDDTYDKLILGAGIGAGVILVSVVVAVAAVAGPEVVSTVIAVPVDSLTKAMKSSNMIVPIAKAIIDYVRTQDIKDAALEVGNDFAWNAISGILKRKPAEDMNKP